ncbi:MAG: SDR family NAD(P)-dependent oxidoreductase [Candidatus Puniceispirillales bacterium]
MSDLKTPYADLSSFTENMRVAVFGTGGGIGSAIYDLLASHPRIEQIFGFSRRHHDPKFQIDFTQPDSIDRACHMLSNLAPVHLVIVATGMLHDEQQGLTPEKSWRHLNANTMAANFQINSIGPALIASKILPLLAKDSKSVFAAISARVGSISDNRLGGWHSYRASKAALNMLLKNFALELHHRNPAGIVIGLHPGTTDTDLSKPFQSGLKHDLFTQTEAAYYLIDVINQASTQNSGQVLAWDGQIIPA